MTTLREEIARRIKLSHTHPNLSLSYMEDADYILKLFEKRIDSMYYDTDATHISDDYDDGITFFFQQVKEMLK